MNGGKPLGQSPRITRTTEVQPGNPLNNQRDDDYHRDDHQKDPDDFVDRLRDRKLTKYPVDDRKHETNEEQLEHEVKQAGDHFTLLDMDVAAGLSRAGEICFIICR